MTLVLYGLLWLALSIVVALLWGIHPGGDAMSDKPTLEQVLRAKSVLEPISGCWLWRGFLNRGRLWVVTYAGKRRAAHRFSWLAWRGELSEKDLVCHRCDVPACINPDHLFLGTHAANASDRNAKGRQIAGISSHNQNLQIKMY